jgi:hypothetical protein
MTIMARTKKDVAEAPTIGKSEIRWMSAYDIDKNLRYVITSNKDRSVYYIYDKDLKRLGKGANPTELERKFFDKE